MPERGPLWLARGVAFGICRGDTARAVAVLDALEKSVPAWRGGESIASVARRHRIPARTLRDLVAAVKSATTAAAVYFQ